MTASRLVSVGAGLVCGAAVALIPWVAGVAMLVLSRGDPGDVCPRPDDPFPPPLYRLLDSWFPTRSSCYSTEPVGLAPFSVTTPMTTLFWSGTLVVIGLCAVAGAVVVSLGIVKGVRAASARTRIQGTP